MAYRRWYNNIEVEGSADIDLNQLIKTPEAELLPLIHHAGISKEALSENDVIEVPWRVVLEQFQEFIKQNP